MLVRKLRSKYSRTVIEDAARECAENPRLNRDGSFDDDQDRAYLVECVERPLRASDWEFFTRLRGQHAKRVAVETAALSLEDEASF